MVRGYGNVVFYGSACGAGLVNRGAGSVGFHSFCLVCGRVRVAVAGGMPPWCGIGGFVARGSGLCALVGWSGVVSGYGARLLRVPVSGRMWERPCSSVFVWPRYVPVCGFDLFGRAGARVCAPHTGNGGMPVRGADYMPLYLFSALPAYGGHTPGGNKPRVPFVPPRRIGLWFGASVFPPRRGVAVSASAERYAPISAPASGIPEDNGFARDS